MSLGSLPSSAISLLDVLVSDHGPRSVMAWKVRRSIHMEQKTARRNWQRLHRFGLVHWDKARKFEQRVQATPLGLALISARYKVRS